ADIHNHLGIAYSASGLIKEGIAEFKRALEINPRFVDALLNLAITLRDNGQTQEAKAKFAQALEIEPDNPIALSNLGQSEPSCPAPAPNADESTDSTRRAA